MPEFKLAAKVTVTAYTKVEAPTLEEAIKMASTRGVVLYSHSHDEQNWVIDEADGEPFDITN